jgi:hypothetical protein
MRDYRKNVPVPAYEDGTKCPGCTGQNWLIGRKLAECAGCGFALVLSQRFTAFCTPVH